MFPRTVVGTEDFAIAFVVHFSTSEIAHHVLKSHWEKWERALSAHRQGLWGAHWRMRIKDLECTQPSCSITFSTRPRKIGPLSALQQELFRHPRPLLEISQSKMLVGEATGKTEEYEWETEEEGVEGMEEDCWSRGRVASKWKFEHSRAL